MRRTVAMFSLLLAWVCAHGAIWDVVQVAAWTRMFSGYVETRSVTEALQETFDASKPCPLCLAVRKAKAAEHTSSRSALQQETVKLVLACQAPAETACRPEGAVGMVAFDAVAPERVEPVPVPPPRV